MKIKKIKIFVLGAGCWGVTLAKIYSEKGYDVFLWEPSIKKSELLKKTRKLKNFSFIQLPKNVKISHDISQIKYYDLILFVTPSIYVRETAQKIKSLNINLKNKYFISCTKGLEEKTMLRPSQIITKILNISINQIFVFSGPTHAEEVVKKKPAAITLAGKNKKILTKLQQVLSTNFLRVYTTTDITGVELGGTLKNVYAIAAGICDGLNLGDNAKSALITRSLKEIVLIGKTLSGETKTFFGLSGIGDLLTTAYSRHSRNRNFGEFLVSTGNLDVSIKKVKTTIEGIKTVKVLHDIGNKYKLDIPIATQIYKIINTKKLSKKIFTKIIKTLFSRKLKPEFYNYL